MIFTKYPSHGRFWHCPFSREWVEMMARAAKACKDVTAERVEKAFNRESMVDYVLPPSDFLSEPQDARGLPLSMCHDDDEMRTCCDVYDYTSIPYIVVSNGYNDWPLEQWEPVLRA